MIAIGAGHYPQDPGAIFPPPLPDGSLPNNAVFEHDLAVLWTSIIAEEIEKFTPVVIVKPGWLGDKVRMINAFKGVEPVYLAAEIHFNSDVRRMSRGSETLYFPGSAAGKCAAETVQRTLGKVFPPNRGPKEGWFRMDRPGHVDYPGDKEGDEKVDFYLKKTRMTSLIIEPEFIHNRVTLDRLRDVGCKAIAQALIVAHQEIKSGGLH